MKRALFPILVILISGTLVLGFGARARAAGVSVANQKPFQGDTVLVNIPLNMTVATATFGGDGMAIFKYKNMYRAIYPLAQTKAPGTYNLAITFQNGSVFARNIIVQKSKFVKYVMPSQPGGPTPAKIVEQLVVEANDLKDVFVRPPETAMFLSSFGLPLHIPLKITSTYGEIRQTGDYTVLHPGIDFAAQTGTRIYAMNDGVVTKAKKYLSDGNTVVIDHGGGISSIYLHLSQISVKEGQKVKKGQIIGNVGTTGYSTGPHLHLSLKIDGVSVDALKFIQTLK